MVQGCLAIVLICFVASLIIVFFQSLSTGFNDALHGYFSITFAIESISIIFFLTWIALGITQAIEKKRKGNYKLGFTLPFKVAMAVAYTLLFGLWLYQFTPTGKIGKTATEKEYARADALQKAQQQSQAAADEAQQQQEAAQEQSQKAADAQKQADQKKQANEEENLTTIGDIGYLRMTGNQKGDKVIVASSADAWQDLAKEALANDNAWIQQMEEQGTAYEVPDGTQARLIDISGVLDPVMRIRIVGGDQDGQEGYIGDNFLKKNNVQ